MNTTHDRKCDICAICRRPLGKSNLSKHHLMPKSKGGKEEHTILIHNICHQKIHSLFTVQELKRNLHIVEDLLAREEMQKFVKWVASKDPQFYQSNRRAKRKKR